MVEVVIILHSCCGRADWCLSGSVASDL
jgi:hypothetical protein